MESTVYNQKGRAEGNITLPEKLFNVPWNADLVHQVVSVMQGNARQGSAHSKNRGEVRGGGKKPWQQKGTGRARHGSIRSPLWVGGGATFGPRNDKNYKRDLSRSMKTKALTSMLSKKYRDGEVAFISDISFAEPKTKEALATLTSLTGIKGFEGISTKKSNAVLLALPSRNVNVEKSFRNVGKVVVDEVRNLNPVDLLTHRYLFIVSPEQSIETLKARLRS